MIDLSNVVSPTLNAQELKVYHRTGSFVNGRWTLDNNSLGYSVVYGVAYPTTEKELRILPEGDRILGRITFITRVTINLSKIVIPISTSDEVEYKKELYKVLYSGPWEDYGYCLSICERKVGA